MWTKPLLGAAGRRSGCFSPGSTVGTAGVDGNEWEDDGDAAPKEILSFEALNTNNDLGPVPSHWTPGKYVWLIPNDYPSQMLYKLNFIPKVHSAEIPVASNPNSRGASLALSSLQGPSWASPARLCNCLFGQEMARCEQGAQGISCDWDSNGNFHPTKFTGVISNRGHVW